MATPNPSSTLSHLASWTPQVVTKTFQRGIAHLKRLFSPEENTEPRASNASQGIVDQEPRSSGAAFASTSPPEPPSTGLSEVPSVSSPSAPPPSLDTWAGKNGPTPSELDEIERTEAAFEELRSPSQTSIYPERESIDPDQEGPDSIGQKMAQRMLESATGGVPDSFR